MEYLFVNSQTVTEIKQIDTDYNNYHKNINYNYKNASKPPKINLQRQRL